MKITTKARYGCRIMVELANTFGKDPVSINEISDAQELSPKYTFALLSALNKSGLVTSWRGNAGGYSLSRPPKKISLLEIFESLEGPVVLVDCVDNKALCHRADICVTRALWHCVGESIKECLGKRSLSDLANCTHGKKKPNRKKMTAKG